MKVNELLTNSNDTSLEYNIKVLRNSRDSEFYYWTFCETLTNRDRKWPPSHSHTSCINTSLPCVVNMGYEKTGLVHVLLLDTSIPN
jgi:hypothetical protein